MTKPAIVLSTHNTGLAVIRALGKHGIPVVAVYYQKSDMGYVSKYVAEKVLAAHPEHCRTDFISLLIDLAQRHGQGLLIPADDATLVAVSKNKELLERHYIVACPDWTIVEQLIDKKHTYRLAESAGIPAPATIVPCSDREAQEYSEQVRYPCLVKPCQSHLYFEMFRRKLVKANNAQELMSAYKQASDAGMEVMLQEFIPGDDSAGVNYNSYYCDDAPPVEFTAEKVRLSPPESGVPGVVVSRHIPEVLRLGRRMLRSIGYSGYSCMEFKKDARDGIYKLMEINPRHNRSSLLAVRCGINFPLMEYMHLVQDRPPSPTAYDEGIYWIDAARDLAASIKYAKKRQFSLFQYVKPYLKPHIFATFDVTDPLPFVKRSADLARTAARTVFRLKKSESQRRQVLIGAQT